MNVSERNLIWLKSKFCLNQYVNAKLNGLVYSGKQCFWAEYCENHGYNFEHLLYKKCSNWKQNFSLVSTGWVLIHATNEESELLWVSMLKHHIRYTENTVTIEHKRVQLLLFLERIKFWCEYCTHNYLSKNKLNFVYSASYIEHH